MNPKSKRPTLNAAFKRVQRLPSLLPKTDGRRPASENASRQPAPAPAVAAPAPNSGALALQFLVE